MSTPTIIILAVVAAIILWSIAVHNRIVHLLNVRRNAFANVDAVLLQRYDLIPQLVGAVAGYAAHEKNTLESVILARAKGMEAVTIDSKLDAARELPGTESRCQFYAFAGKIIGNRRKTC